jgi:glycosyltransferase involved in cell wall biosynthesis
MKSVYYWSPFTSRVATVKAVINSAYSLNKYSSNYKTFIINSYGEWDLYIQELKNKNINLLTTCNINFLKKINKTGYVKSRIASVIIFFFNFYPLLRLLIKKKPDYLLIHLITSLPIVLKIIFPIQTKIILRISGLPKLNFLRKMLWKLASQFIYKVTCPTFGTLIYLKSLRIFDEDQIVLLRDPIVDINFIAFNKNKKLEENFIKEKKYILAIGRLTQQKNFIFLINSFADLIKKFSDIQLIIIGEGEQSNLLREVIKKNNLKNHVFLIGYKENVYKYYNNSIFFVLTSLWEDPGFVLIESFASNTLVLSSDCPNGPKEIINNGKNGFLFRMNDKNDFLRNLYYILENKNKKEIAEKILSGKVESKKYTKYAHFKIINGLLK